MLPLNIESAGQANAPPGSEPRTWLLPMLIHLFTCCPSPSTESFPQVLPLNLESAGQANVPPGSEPRTWLLPMLRRHVCGTKLGFWGKTLLPLAKAMAARSEAAAAAGRNALSQVSVFKGGCKVG